MLTTTTARVWSVFFHRSKFLPLANMTWFRRNRHLVVHHVFRLRMVWIWPAVGLPLTLVALIIPEYAAIHNMYRLVLSTHEYLRKMAQNWPLISKKPWHNFPYMCEHGCVIATQVVIFDCFFLGFQGQWFYNVVQVFSAISIDPSGCSYPINTRYSVNNENFVFSHILKKKVFSPNVSHQIWSCLWVMNAGIAVPRFRPIAMENCGLAC